MKTENVIEILSKMISDVKYSKLKYTSYIISKR